MTANSYSPPLEGNDDGLAGEMPGQFAGAAGTDTANDQQHETDNPCQNCGKHVGVDDSWCRQCGYYPTLGRCVDLAEWEQHYENGEYVGPTEETPVSIWRGIPLWAWKLGGVLVIVTIMTLAAGLVMPEGSPERTGWSVAQAALGFLVFAAVHLRVAIGALTRDRTLGILDVVTSPIRIWLEVILDFPRSFRVVAIAFGGISATVLAHAIIGVPYSELISFDHKPAPRKQKPSLVAMMAKKMAARRPTGEQKTLEEALNDFADGAGVDDLAGVARGVLGEPEEEKDPNAEELACLVVGWLPAEEGENAIGSLVLAVKMKRQWRLVGTVSDGLTPELQAELMPKLGSLSASNPVVKCNREANWLKPELYVIVEIKFSEENPERPSGMKVLRVLSD